MTGDDGPWTNGNVDAPFTRLMALERVDANTFKSTFPAFSPGQMTRAFGGHVYAQSALAAAKTVGEGFLIYVCISCDRCRSA